MIDNYIKFIHCDCAVVKVCIYTYMQQNFLLTANHLLECCPYNFSVFRCHAVNHFNLRSGSSTTPRSHLVQ